VGPAQRDAPQEPAAGAQLLTPILVSLARHAGTDGDPVRAIDARVRRQADGTLALTYTLTGDLARVRVPRPGPSRSADPLWQHTCCEIFIARAGSAAYHEFNFAPSGEWAAYAFGDYRAGAPLADPALDPQVSVRSAAGKLELDALIRLDRLSPQHPGAALSLGLAAVVEDSSGALGYWALRHAPGKPDFHHPDSFALKLDEIRD
jgi:hypothetical protein